MTFTYVVDFRGGVYCSQVEAIDVHSSLLMWVRKIKSELKEIKHLGKKTSEEIKKSINDPDNKPIKLKGLRNIWCIGCSTRKGSFLINIIQTDISHNDYF